MNIYQIIIRVALAIIIGGLIGYNRASRNIPAGFRTHILVCLGATIVALVETQLGYTIYSEIARNPGLRGVTQVDCGRLTAQVISGVGFLGAGTILRDKGAVRGLTTAASVWAVACIGLAIGYGMYRVSIIGAIGIIIVLNLLKKFENKFMNKVTTFKFEISYEDKKEAIEFVESYLEFRRIKVRNIEFNYGEDGIGKAIFLVEIVKAIDLNDFTSELGVGNGIMNIEIIK